MTVLELVVVGLVLVTVAVWGMYGCIQEHNKKLAEELDKLRRQCVDAGYGTWYKPDDWTAEYGIMKFHLLPPQRLARPVPNPPTEFKDLREQQLSVCMGGVADGKVVHLTYDSIKFPVPVEIDINDKPDDLHRPVPYEVQTYRRHRYLDGNSDHPGWYLYVWEELTPDKPLEMLIEQYMTKNGNSCRCSGR